MIVEVHNISRERRPFLLYDGHSIQEMDKRNKATRFGGSKIDSRVRYVHQKDFHSSEFNGRDGTYTPNAVNPMHAPKNGTGSLDASITMKSVEGQVMVVARMKSKGLPMESGKLSFVQKLSLFWFCYYATLLPCKFKFSTLSSVNLANCTSSTHGMAILTAAFPAQNSASASSNS